MLPGQEAADELRQLAGTIAPPAKSLVVARHALEWWTAWYLHTHIAHIDALTENDWKLFDQVFVLRQKGGMQRIFGGMGFGPGGPRRPRMPKTVPGDSSPDLPPANDFTNLPLPPSGRGPSGSMGEPMIPRNAEISYQGKKFTLARVVSFLDIRETGPQHLGPPPGDEFQ